MRVDRPAVQYYGGKWKIAGWVTQYFPRHRTYVEPFGGGGNVLLRKVPSREEVYNDLDKTIVNFFKVLRDPAKAEELRRRLYLSLMSRTDYQEASRNLQEGDDIERARRLVILSSFGFGTVALGKEKNGNAPTGFRIFGHAEKKGLHAIRSRWMSWPSYIPIYTERLRTVLIENKPAIELIQEWDKPDTLFYVDPPYLADTRVTNATDYSHEMTRKDHIELAKVLRRIKGMAIVSGYESNLYSKIYAGWRLVRHKTHTFSGKKNNESARMECLWISPTISRNFLF